MCTFYVFWYVFLRVFVTKSLFLRERPDSNAPHTRVPYLLYKNLYYLHSVIVSYNTSSSTAHTY